MQRIWKSKPKPTREENLSVAAGKLKRAEALIIKNQNDIQAKLRGLDQQAQRYVNSYPQMARSCLRQKQALLQQHANITKQLATVQTQLNGLEMNLVTTEVSLFEKTLD